jgi:fluoroquinolone transport system permease protein
MHTLKALRILGPIDAVSMRRDAMLRWLAALPLALALAARWLLPGALRRIGGLLGFDIMAYYAPVMGYALLLIAPAVCGMVVGFLLLDQRDDRSLMALQVSPLPLRSYLAYRIAAPLLVSLLLSLLALPLAGLAALSDPALLLAALAAAPLAPLTALCLAAFAENKVQGFALQKALGVLLIAPVLALFLPLPWRLALGLLPTYWPAALLWGLQQGALASGTTLAAGLIYQALLLALLLRRFTRVMYRQ